MMMITRISKKHPPRAAADERLGSSGRDRARRVSDIPPVRGLTAPIDARVSPGAGKAAGSVKHLLGEVSGPSAP
jgi:hypothetical protein